MINKTTKIMHHTQDTGKNDRKEWEEAKTFIHFQVK